MAVAGAASCLALAACTHAGQAVRQPASTSPRAAPVATAPVATAPAATTTSPATTTPNAGVASYGCDGNTSGPTFPGTPPPPISSATSWPEVTVVAGMCPQVLDVAAGAGFSLVSAAPTSEGPWVLQRIDLSRATTESGPTFPVGALTVAAGYLWISCGRSSGGDAVGPLLCQVDLRTLAVVRQIQLPPPGLPAFGADILVAPGPDDTVWVGYGRTLVHIAVGEGAVLSSVPIVSGTVASLSVDPAGQYLYAALSYPTVAGKAVDASVLEFEARTGQALAATSADNDVTDAVAGGDLTAVPGGVWDSFRTGMAGATIFLRQSDLALAGPPSSELGAPQPDGVFTWIMDASTIYGDGALFLVNQNGIMACADARTGVIRVQEHWADAQGVELELLAVDAPSGRVLVSDGNGVQAITPPAACWG